MEVRQLTAEDLEQLVPLGEEAAITGAIPSFSADDFLDLWRKVLEQAPDLFAVLVAEDERGNPVGALGFILAPNPFTGAREARAAFYYVRPQHRRQGVGTLLLDEARLFASKWQASSMVFSVHEDAPHRDAMDDFYQREGFARQSIVYELELD